MELSLPGGGLGFQSRTSCALPSARLRGLPRPSMAALPRQLGGHSGSSPPPGFSQFSSVILKTKSSKRLLEAFFVCPEGDLNPHTLTSTST